MPFVCNICGEESARICARCTKDTCNNHLCEKCLKCSDCCECEVTLAEHPPAARSVVPRREPPPVEERPQPPAIEEPLEPPQSETPPETLQPPEPAL